MKRLPLTNYSCPRATEAKIAGLCLAATGPRRRLIIPVVSQLSRGTLGYGFAGCQLCLQLFKLFPAPVTSVDRGPESGGAHNDHKEAGELVLGRMNHRLHAGDVASRRLGPGLGVSMPITYVVEIRQKLLVYLSLFGGAIGLVAETRSNIVRSWTGDVADNPATLFYFGK